MSPSVLFSRKNRFENIHIIDVTTIAAKIKSTTIIYKIHVMASPGGRPNVHENPIDVTEMVFNY